jgi:S1-C subfamily serine protease
VTPGGPAAAAEIETGDLITAIGDTPVFSACDLGDALTRVQAGGTLDLDVCRGTRRSSRTVTLR